MLGEPTVQPHSALSSPAPQQVAVPTERQTDLLYLRACLQNVDDLESSSPAAKGTRPLPGNPSYRTSPTWRCVEGWTLPSHLVPRPRVWRHLTSGLSVGQWLLLQPSTQMTPNADNTQSSSEVSLRTGAWNQPDCSSGSSQSRRHQFKALPRAPLCCPSLEEGTPQTHGLWMALQLCHLGDPTTSSPHHCNVAAIALGKNLQLPSHYTPSIRASGVSRPKPILTEKNLRKDPETQRWRTGCRHLQEW